jgi:phage/plasmid-associated DNA primase
MWRRIMLVPFEVTIPDEEKDNPLRKVKKHTSRGSKRG